MASSLFESAPDLLMKQISVPMIPRHACYGLEPCDNYVLPSSSSLATTRCLLLLISKSSFPRGPPLSKLPRYGLIHPALAKAVYSLVPSSVYTSPLHPIISTFHIQPTRRTTVWPLPFTLKRSWHWAQSWGSVMVVIKSCMELCRNSSPRWRVPHGQIATDH